MSSWDQNISKLLRVEVEPGKGPQIRGVCHLIGIAEQTDHRWRHRYRGPDQQGKR